MALNPWVTPRRPTLWLLAASMLSGGSAHAQNPVVLENLRPGVSDWVIPAERKVDVTVWSTTDRSIAQIEGYASLTSVAPGQVIRFYVHTGEPSYQMRFYRVGWYGGAGARELTKVERPGVEQPPCAREPVTNMVECHWTDPYELRIPDDWLSGIYLVKLTAETSRRENYMTFVVRDDRSADLLFLAAVNTYQAYNWWGGYNLYGGARKVSFNRPYGHWDQWAEGVGDFFAWEINMVRWLEREGYDVSYGTNVDMHESLGTLLKHRAVLSVGHDEYWSWEMRRHAEQARESCVSLAFFSANSVYWQVRFEPSPITGEPNRVLVGYRDRALVEDPLATDGRLDNDHLITTQWRNPRPGFLRAQPEDALLGVMYAFFPVNTEWVVSDPGHWAFAGTSATRLPGLVGYEADRMFGNAPPGTVRLARSPVAPTATYDCEPAADNCYSEATIYQAPSGALVFATGSIQWPWGLDDFAVPGAFPRGPAHPDAQQIARNVLGEMTRASCAAALPLPPARAADLAVSVSGIAGTGRLRLIECARRGTCFATTRSIRAGYPTILLYGREEMRQIHPLRPPAPPPRTHRLVGSRWDLQASAKYQGPVWITLGYEALGLSSEAEAELDVLYVARGPNGPEWRVAPTTRDAKADAIQAKLPRLTSVVLGVRRK